METDKQLIADLTVIHCEGEGDWCLTYDSCVGEDDE